MFTQIEFWAPDILSMSTLDVAVLDQLSDVGFKLNWLKWSYFVSNSNSIILSAVGNSDCVKVINEQSNIFLPMPDSLKPADYAKLIHVGGAWWSKRHDTGTEIRNCYPSGIAVAVSFFSDSSKNHYDLPAVCGLVASEPGNPLLIHPVMKYTEGKDGETRDEGALIAGDGTSFATPQVAAIVALMLQAAPNLKQYPKIVRDLLQVNGTALQAYSKTGTVESEFFVPQNNSFYRPVQQAPPMVDLMRSVAAARRWQAVLNLPLQGKSLEKLAAQPTAASPVS